MIRQIIINDDMFNESKLTICLGFLEYSKIYMVGIFANRYPALRDTCEFTITHISRSSFEIGYSTYLYFIRTCRAVDLGLNLIVNFKIMILILNCFVRVLCRILYSIFLLSYFSFYCCLPPCTPYCFSIVFEFLSIFSNIF